ncbi:hypothetical protein VNO77_00805 [Canavalia gladiata]|uniref:Uncharacterized protein n=1 Tax=Canavalia gladiata TaxID=3824 RepID=A0AAN9R1N2_CANGL
MSATHNVMVKLKWHYTTTCLVSGPTQIVLHCLSYFKVHLAKSRRDHDQTKTSQTIHSGFLALLQNPRDHRKQTPISSGKTEGQYQTRDLSRAEIPKSLCSNITCLIYKSMKKGLCRGKMCIGPNSKITPKPGFSTTIPGCMQCSKQTFFKNHALSEIKSAYLFTKHQQNRTKKTRIFDEQDHIRSKAYLHR